jgi:TPR repeat protein
MIGAMIDSEMSASELRFLCETERSREAEDLLTGRAEAGDGPALANLTAVLLDGGRADELEPILRRQADGGSPVAVILLAGVMKYAKRTQEAQFLLAKVLAEMDPVDLEAVVELLIDEERFLDAETMLRLAAEEGHAWAMRRLGQLLFQDELEIPDGPEDFEEALTWLSRAANAGDSEE